MKKLLKFAVSLLVLTAASSLNNVSARDLNSDQLALRNEIMSFLREEGYMPEIDSDGDIKFKSEGNTFYVTVSAADENPMYVTLFRVFSNPDEYSADVLLRATKNLNFYKGVKILCYESSFRICTEMYLRNAELFKQSFYKMVSQINNLKSDVLDECKAAAANGGSSGGASVSEIPFIVTSMEIANVDQDGNIIQGYGSTIYDYKTKYLKPKITIKPFRTSGTYTVYVKLYKGNVLNRNTSSSPENYTFSNTITIDGSGSQTFELSGWGTNNAGNWSIDTYRYEVWINDYCVGSKTFRVI